MPAGMLRTIVIVAVCLCNGAFAVAGGRHRHAPASVKGTAPAVTLAADRDPYADPAAPYKADRLSLPPRGEPILNTPGQTTVLTRQVLDDMNATTLRDALRSTAGVTVGR